MDNKAIIAFQNVYYAYQGDEEGETIPAVENLSFSIVRGEFVALLGHNGSGKSTVAKLCNGLLTPTGGTVLVDGLNAADENNLFDVRKRVGIVFQNPDNQIIAALIEDDVAFGPENLCIPHPELRERVDGALKAVDMYEYRLAEPHKLSGGQKQRVAIAGILAMENDVIVLDESTAMLDPRGRREVLEAVRKLNRERGITVLFITHFMEEAAQADRVMVMDDGELALDGTPRFVFAQRDILRRAGLELPLPLQLADALRGIFPQMPQDILTNEDCTAAIAALFAQGETQ
ncbi:MAG: energy-coupling factor transporter ATPase [Oscillospiraceae bacterium]|nr:energy-coupling factor transporter ATPase [Oscillospiraceae bacterium]